MYQRGNGFVCNKAELVHRRFGYRTLGCIAGVLKRKEDGRA